MILLHYIAQLVENIAPGTGNTGNIMFEVMNTPMEQEPLVIILRISETY